MYCVFSETLDLVQGDWIWMISLLDFSRNLQKLQNRSFSAICALFSSHCLTLRLANVEESSWKSV